MDTIREILKVLTGRELPNVWLLALVSIVAAVGFQSMSPLQEETIGNWVRSLSADVVASNFAFLALLSLLVFATLASLLIGRARSVQSKMIIIDGVMRYKDEVHIALRVATLKNIVHSLVRRMDPRESEQIMLDCGLVAGRDFMSRFPQIFDNEISGDSGKTWTNLQISDKLDEWTKYDRGGGWGNIKIIGPNPRYHAQIDHVSLFAGPVGRQIAFFMAGYVNGVLEGISENAVKMSGTLQIGGEDEGSIFVEYA